MAIPNYTNMSLYQIADRSLKTYIPDPIVRHQFVRRVIDFTWYGFAIESFLVDDYGIRVTYKRDRCHVQFNRDLFGLADHVYIDLLDLLSAWLDATIQTMNIHLNEIWLEEVR